MEPGQPRAGGMNLEVVSFADPRERPVSILRGSGSHPPDFDLFGPASVADLDRVAFAVDGTESGHGADLRMWRDEPNGPQGPIGGRCSGRQSGRRRSGRRRSGRRSGERRHLRVTGGTAPAPSGTPRQPAYGGYQQPCNPSAKLRWLPSELEQPRSVVLALSSLRFEHQEGLYPIHRSRGLPTADLDLTSRSGCLS